VIELNGRLRLSEHSRLATERVGREKLPVLVIDDFLDDPGVLVEYAAADSAFDGVSDAFYPGIRAPIPPIYCFALRAFLGELIGKTFGLESSRLTGEVSHFSLITTPASRLQVLQRIPHFDNTNPKQLAVLHYLCRPGYGGTSFYRHRRTGFEFIDAERRPLYSSVVAKELDELGPPPARYICGDDPLFERTATFEAAFNRVLIYRSIDLHSADIPPDSALEADPRSGRLTANTFFY
jgi:hypothetical protein